MNQSSVGVQYFSGQVGEQNAGLYIFTFSVKGPQTGVSVNFIIHDLATYGNGISLSIDEHGRTTMGTQPMLPSLSAWRSGR